MHTSEITQPQKALQDQVLTHNKCDKTNRDPRLRDTIENTCKHSQKILIIKDSFKVTELYIESLEIQSVNTTC